MRGPDKHIFVQSIVLFVLSFLTSGGGESRNLACEMLIAIDEPLYRTIYKENVTKTTEMAEDYIRRINRIYQKTFLSESNHLNGEAGRIYFRLREVRILFNFCLDPQCNQSQQYLLDEFEKIDTRDFCLAHLFTYRDIPGGIQGLGYKKTVCRKRWNKGFTTLLNHKLLSTIEDSAMTFSHEVGHNFGAIHDDDTSPSRHDCRQSTYIMSSTGSSEKDLRFSHCSLQNMSKTLDHVFESKRPLRDCFVRMEQSYHPNDYSFCGNGILEGFEECDCGMHYTSCNDPCCYAAEIDPIDYDRNKTAIPCRRGRVENCKNPYHSVIKYGLYVPLIFIGIMMPITTMFLCWDWRSGKRMSFKHVDSDTESNIRPEMNTEHTFTQNGDAKAHKPLVKDSIGQPIIKEKKNGTIGNGVILQSHVSPRKVNRYVKRPEPTSIACTSSSASPTTSQTASHTTSFYISDKECSSISSSTFDHNFDPNSQANQRKQDALFKEMLQKAPKHPQRDIKEHGYVSRYISSGGKSPYTKPKRYENVEEEEIDLVPKRRAPPPPSHSASISSTSVPDVDKRISSPVKRPKEPPPPAPNINK